MAGLNVKKMKKKAATMATSGDFLKFDEGDTLLYVHPMLPQAEQHESTDGTNFIEFGVHYKIGPQGKMVVSQDKTQNEILDHPYLVELLKKKKVKLKGSCPVAELLESGELTDDEADASKLKQSYLWGVTPLSYRRNKTGEFQPVPFAPGILQAGKQITEGILDAICEEGDITDPKAAILVRVSRKGQGMDTEYKVKIDTGTLKKPMKLSKTDRASLAKAMAAGGDCDLFRVLAGMIKSKAQVQALIDGMEMDSAVDDDDSEEGAPVDDSDEGEAVDDSEEGEAVDDSEEGEAVDDSEEGEPESEEGEPEDDESEEGEPEPEPEPKPKKKKKNKAEAKPEKKAKAKAKTKPEKKAKPKKKAKAKKKEEDDDDDGLGDIDAELARLTDEDD